MAQSFGSAAERTRFFALLDLAVNTLTVLTQVLITSRLLTRLGVAGSLALVPLLSALGFALLALTPVLAALAAFQVLRRAGDYAITRPAREMLYTVVDREAKYKAKNALDTLVYRGGDALAGWLFTGLKVARAGACRHRLGRRADRARLGRGVCLAWPPPGGTFPPGQIRSILQPWTIPAPPPAATCSAWLPAPRPPR